MLSRCCASPEQGPGVKMAHSSSALGMGRFAIGKAPGKRHGRGQGVGHWCARYRCEWRGCARRKGHPTDHGVGSASTIHRRSSAAGGCAGNTFGPIAPQFYHLPSQRSNGVRAPSSPRRGPEWEPVGRGSTGSQLAGLCSSLARSGIRSGATGFPGRERCHTSITRNVT
jgi:hypothetical protein